MFQYITCYSLSTVDSNLCAVSSRFNTSHVTLYLWQQKQVHLWNSFNTSHVTLYHWPIFPGTHYSLVSIHHMLLFICSRQDSGENVPGFQYITCYSLSKKRVRKNTGRILFQYITCYSLSTRYHGWWRRGKRFQYITCYSLSKTFLIPLKLNNSFNTSHVTLYL